ncbi:MAG: addiction module protein [Gammaproteobacteria bacterium]|nr:addiction module protein [Gammaproteobacteria bacterium]
MSSILKLPLEDRIRLVEDIWDSIAAEQSSLELTDAQRMELDKRLDAYEGDGDKGREASEVIADIKSRL